jgi:hypothetical protein
MKPSEFINKKIEYLKFKFKDIEIKYQYKITTDIHIIKISPLSLYENNIEYIKEEEDIENEFTELYPFEELLFISEDSLIKI